MPASFPLNPVDGQEYVLGTKTYIWSESKGIWELLLDGSGLNLTNLITNIIPSADDTYNIGTTTQQWKNLHIAGSLFLDGAEITANQDGSVNLPAGAQIVADIPETLLDLNITDGSQGQVLVTSGQGTFSFADKIGLGSFSVDTSATNSGAGGLSYNGATGVFTFTKPDLSSYSTFSGEYADLINKPSIPQSITALTDVDTTGASDGEILQYNAFAGRWESVSNSGGIDLTAFSISTQDATDTPTLSYNNTTGVFTYTPPDISEFITKADISVGTAGAASGAGDLSYNSTSGVFTYTPPDLDSFVTDVSLALDDLTDVAASTPTDGQVLKWNNASSQWVPRADNSGIALDDLSVTVNTEPSGAGNLLYNNSSGVFTLTKPDLSPYATSASLATVATSGSYDDLTDTPSIPTAIEDLDNVTIQTDEQQLPELADGQVLTWDDTAQYWTNANNTAIALGDLSVTANAVPAGDGAIDYDNTTGEFQFVPPEIPRDVNELNDADGLLSGPIIISVSPTEFDGNTGTTFTIRGGNLKSGANILFKDSDDSYWTAGTTTFLSSSEITATTPKDFTVANGPLGIKYEFGAASTEITNIISTGALPYWQTPSGTILTVEPNDTIESQVNAIDPDGSTITYALTLGSLPPNTTLSSSGRISGTAPSGDDPITYTFTIRATDVGGNFVDQQFSIAYTGVQSGEQIYDVPGSYTFTVPSGVTQLSVVLIGAGGGGNVSTKSPDGFSGGGGAGGGLAWANFSTSPGQTYTVEVGAGGAGGTIAGSNNAANGGRSAISDSNRNTLIAATGGNRGSYNSIGLSLGGFGTSTAFAYGGGTGGRGGGGANGNAGGGGGGAAGYSGNGGQGTTYNGNISTSGSGGGGGGAGGVNGEPSSLYGSRYQGGGVGLYGEGTSGAGVSSNNLGGFPGSVDVWNGVGQSPSYGGGGSGAEDDSGNSGAAGQPGAVRIVWGAGVSYPNNAVI